MMDPKAGGNQPFKISTRRGFRMRAQREGTGCGACCQLGRGSQEPQEVLALQGRR